MGGIGGETTAAAQVSGSKNDPNIGGIVGGVVGGVMGLALLATLIFFCIRKRKSRQAAGWSEKNEEEASFVTKLRAVPSGIGALFARVKGEKSGPVSNPYKRHVPRGSVSSVYSVNSDGRVRSMSETSAQAPAAGFMRRMSNRKSTRNVLRKKNSSVSSQSAFIGILTEPVLRDSKTSDFVYPQPSPDPPRNLTLVNPDTEGIANQGPRTPQPTARDPFASLIGEIDDDTPNWMPASHQRTPSTNTALRSTAASSVYSTNPFNDPPPLPTAQTLGKTQTPATNYSAFPTPRESRLSYDGLSRPGTTVFPGNTVRQSDPFDLDRPEVLGLRGIMTQMRESLVRQASFRSRRPSVSTRFARESGVLGPALNGSSIRR